VSGSSTAHASVSVNSLGLIDNLQIAATGLAPGKKYRLVLVRGHEEQDLVILSAGIGGVAIAQTLGPLKRVVITAPAGPDPTLQLKSVDDGTVVLEQAVPSRPPI
jgi:hypothetical protein